MYIYEERKAAGAAGGRIPMQGRADEHQSDFANLAEGIRPRLIAYCRHMLWEPEHLEDALQTVLATACEKFSQFEAGTNFAAWIFRISTHVIFNANRRMAKERERFVSHDDEQLDIIAELQREYAYDELLRNPERVLAHVGDEMHGALMTLTPPERSVFLLKIIGDLSCREIAEILQMPTGSVMGYLARARGKLRSHLAEYARQYGFISNDVRKEKSNGLPES